MREPAVYVRYKKRIKQNSWNGLLWSWLWKVFVNALVQMFPENKFQVPDLILKYTGLGWNIASLKERFENLCLTKICRGRDLIRTPPFEIW